MDTEYIIRSTHGLSPSAVVSLKEEGKEESKIAELFSNSDGYYTLIETNGRRFWMTERVDGELRPFSLEVRLDDGRQNKTARKPFLKILDRLFSYGGKIYIVSNVSESKPREHFHGGPKYISRLDGLRADDPGEIDLMTRSRSERRLRGVHVGELSGIGSASNGHRVTFRSDELKEIALPLAVASFLINTTPDGARLSGNLRAA